MSSADGGEGGARRAAPTPSRARRWTLWVAGALLGVATVVLTAVLAVSATSGGERSLLIGALNSDRIASLALVLALVCLAVGLCAITVPRIWLVLLVPVRLVAIAAVGLAAFFVWITSSVTVVPLLSAGCETGYVVEEESFLLLGTGTVYRTDGVVVTTVARTTGDDGYHPFADGAYTVVQDGDVLRVWYDVVSDPFRAPTPTIGEPSFTLPARTGETFACGISVPQRAPMTTRSSE